MAFIKVDNMSYGLVVNIMASLKVITVYNKCEITTLSWHVCKLVALPNREFHGMGKILAETIYEKAPKACTKFLHMMLALNQTKITKGHVITVSSLNISMHFCNEDYKM